MIRRGKEKSRVREENGNKKSFFLKKKKTKLEKGKLIGPTHIEKSEECTKKSLN